MYARKVDNLIYINVLRRITLMYRSLLVAEIARCEKSLVTRCKIRSLLAAEVACCKSHSLLVAKFARYSLRKLLVAEVARCKNSLVTRCRSCSLQKITRYSLQSSLVTRCKNSLVTRYKKNQRTNVYLKPIKLSEFYLFILYF